jgi:hypothetical protein
MYVYILSPCICLTCLLPGCTASFLFIMYRTCMIVISTAPTNWDRVQICPNKNLAGPKHVVFPKSNHNVCHKVVHKFKIFAITLWQGLLAENHRSRCTMYWLGSSGAATTASRRRSRGKREAVAKALQNHRASRRLRASPAVPGAARIEAVSIRRGRGLFGGRN